MYSKRMNVLYDGGVRERERKLVHDKMDVADRQFKCRKGH